MCITVCVYLFVLISFCIFSQSVGSLVSGKDTVRFLRVGFRKYGSLESFVDFGAMYIVALFYRLLSHLSFFLHFFLICLFPYLSFENRPSPFPGQRSLEATKGPNIGFLKVVLVHFMLKCSLSTSQEISWVQHLWNDLCQNVNWDVTLNSIPFCWLKCLKDGTMWLCTDELYQDHWAPCRLRGVMRPWCICNFDA